MNPPAPIAVFCPTCNSRVTLPNPGRHKCPNCGEQIEGGDPRSKDRRSHYGWIAKLFLAIQFVSPAVAAIILWLGLKPRDFENTLLELSRTTQLVFGGSFFVVLAISAFLIQRSDSILKWLESRAGRCVFWMSLLIICLASPVAFAPFLRIRKLKAAAAADAENKSALRFTVSQWNVATNTLPTSFYLVLLFGKCVNHGSDSAKLVINRVLFDAPSGRKYEGEIRLLGEGQMFGDPGGMPIPFPDAGSIPSQIEKLIVKGDSIGGHMLIRVTRQTTNSIEFDDFADSDLKIAYSDTLGKTNLFVMLHSERINGSGLILPPNTALAIQQKIDERNRRRQTNR